jgi:hypothetical protein
MNIFLPIISIFIILSCTPVNRPQITEIAIDNKEDNEEDNKNTIEENNQTIGESIEGSSLCPVSSKQLSITCYGSVSDFDEVISKHYMLSFYKKYDASKKKQTLHVRSLNTANSVISLEKIQKISAKLIKENKTCKSVGFNMRPRSTDVREISFKICNHESLKKLDHIVLTLRLRTSSGLAKPNKQLKVKWDSILKANSHIPL